MMYAQEWDEYLPTPISDGLYRWGGTLWKDGYVKNHKVFICPSVKFDYNPPASGNWVFCYYGMIIALYLF